MPQTSRNQKINPVTEQAYGQGDHRGIGAEGARRDHTHGTPSNPFGDGVILKNRIIGRLLGEITGLTGAEVTTLLSLATTLLRGVVFLATEAEVLAGIEATKAVTPATLAALRDATPRGSFYGSEIGFSAAVNNSYTIVADTDISPGPLSDITYTDAGTTLTIGTAGCYSVAWYLAVEVGTDNRHVRAGIMVDSTTVLSAPGINHIEPQTANKQYAMSGCADLDLAAGAVLGVGVGSGDSVTIAVDHIGLCVKRIGST
ncbi:MAG: hypothetical protein ABIJ57_00370 [Pseudomonadota bacterium]|uniref:Putative tail protein n=1 Tax=viral metagenome TaxID=1070528 RepID=A0A6M3KXF9_9ZZZZ